MPAPGSGRRSSTSVAARACTPRGWPSRGYDVVLIDPVPLHVEQARARGCPEARIGDARALDRPDRSADAVLLMGPLYHLVDRDERLQAWREAARVVRPGGVVAAALDLAVRRADRRGRPRLRPRPGLRRGRAPVRGDGGHGADAGVGFTTAYFHHPDEIADEVADAGLELDAVYGIEGPGEWMADLDARPRRSGPPRRVARSGPDDRDRADACSVPAPTSWRSPDLGDRYAARRASRTWSKAVGSAAAGA